MRPVNPLQRPAPWLLTVALQALLLLTFALPLRSAHALSFDAVGAGELLFKTGNEWQPSLRLGTRVDIQVTGLVARVTLEQRFQNPNKEWAEGSYVFPLPATAAVAEMRITVDDRVIIGEVREKQAAETIYKEAKAAGKRTALLDQNQPNLFRTRVANLGPGQEISVTLVYLEKVTFDSGEFRLRFPMTVTERFDPDAERRGAEEKPATNPDTEPHYEKTGAPPNPVQIIARIDAGLMLAEIRSPYHPVHIEAPNGDTTAYQVALANNIAPMDRDFVLRWRPTPGTAPRAALFAEQIEGDTYAMLMVMPPQTNGPVESHRQGLSREVIFVIDTSGSMQGQSIDAARQALGSAMRTLKRDDRFNIIAFNDQPMLLFNRPQLADGSYLRDGWEFVNRLEAGGGTRIMPALHAALEGQPEITKGAVRQVIFITDGAVTNGDKLFRLIDNKLGQSRLFTVGIGSAPNSHFMRKAAQFGRGSFTYIAETAEAQHEMTALFDKLATPQLQNLQVNWSGPAEMFPARVPDLYAGEPLVVTARLAGSAAALRARIEAGNGQWQANLQLPDTTAHRGISTLWARDKLESLYDHITENGESDATRDSIIEIGLRHKLISRYTSFVAVEQTPVRPAGTGLNSSRVPNARPAGRMLALPQTDAGTFTRLLLGSLSLLLALLALRARTHAGARL